MTTFHSRSPVRAKIQLFTGRRLQPRVFVYEGRDRLTLKSSHLILELSKYFLSLAELGTSHPSRLPVRITEPLDEKLCSRTRTSTSKDRLDLILLGTILTGLRRWSDIGARSIRE